MNTTNTVAPHLADIAAKLQDPVVVHVAMLRGEIAKPAIRDMLHVYGADAVARWDASEAQPERRPLTEQQVYDLMPVPQPSMTYTDQMRWMARAVERAHGIGVIA